MTSSNAIRDILQDIDVGEILYDEPMSLHTSLAVGGKADALITIGRENQLERVVKRLREKQINIFSAGNLTNVIVKDGGFRGAILLMTGLKKIDCCHTESGDVFIDAQAGAPLAGVVSRSLTEEITGFEFCSGIPGSVGGAVWMNAGAYGKEIKDVISFVTVIDGEGKKKILRREDIAFAYRTSNLSADVIICGARFVLQKGNREQIRERMADIMQSRQEKHPLQYPSAGSVFKNLPGLPAGKLIEELGLKGARRGDVQVSKKHANFIVNKGQGTAADMMNLIAFIQDKARKEKGVTLETEIVIIGEDL